MKKEILLTAVTCMLVMDYFLFVTGNYSLIYSVLGGWFVVNNIIFLAVVSYTVYWAYKVNRRAFLGLYLVVVSLFSITLYFISDKAREYAMNDMRTAVSQVLESGLSSEMIFTQDTKRNFDDLSGGQYELLYEAFVPTKRRIDFLVLKNDGSQMRLILMKQWNNTCRVHLDQASQHNNSRNTMPYQQMSMSMMTGRAAMITVEGSEGGVQLGRA